MIKPLLFSVLFTSVMITSSAELNATKIIIDNDAGGDDAMAIFLTLLFEKYFNGPDLVGLTTCNGNTNEDNVCINNKRILKVAKRQDVPIFRGSKSSIVITPEAGSYFGKDGLGDSDEPDTSLHPEHRENAVSMLLEQSRIHEGKLIVVTIGTLTNVALAIKLDPTFLGRLAHLYVGAGHIHNDKYPSPEFNAHMDVEAYHIMAQNASPDKVTIFPFSQTQESLNLSKDWRENVLGAIDTEIIKAQNIYERVVLPKDEGWAALDPATAAIAVRPDLVEEYRYSRNDIILCGERRGITTNEFVEKESANVRIVYSVKKEEYKQFLIEVFTADLKEKQ